MIKIQMRLVPSLPSVHVTNVPSVAYKLVPCELHLDHLNNCHIISQFTAVIYSGTAVTYRGHKLE